GLTHDRIALVEAYSKAQGMWRDGDGSELVFTDTLELDLNDVVPSMAGFLVVGIHRAGKTGRDILERDKAFRTLRAGH
ncbi:hypothetical protein ACC758_39755, partial [Rhizobium ruizarguesonis]